MMDNPISYYIFEFLYWTGIRSGELLALTVEDFDFTKSTLRINKSYQRIECQDIITDPKTPKRQADNINARLFGRRNLVIYQQPVQDRKNRKNIPSNKRRSNKKAFKIRKKSKIV